MAANEIQHWGAMLFDFYHVQRTPNFAGLQSTSTLSKLAAWMKANGEDYAKEELEQADEEDDPEEIFPCDIAKLVEDAEMRERMGVSRMLKELIGKGKEKGRDFLVPLVFSFCVFHIGFFFLFRSRSTRHSNVYRFFNIVFHCTFCQRLSML